jgi:transposase, IS5 family
VTDASVHDSQKLERLIDRDDAGQKLYADSAYNGQVESIDWCGMTSEMHENASRNHSLTDEQKSLNRVKSKSRARVEHLFGFMTNSMDAMHVHTIGIFRAAAKIGLTNLTYNMMRCVQLKKKACAVFLYDQYATVMG